MKSIEIEFQGLSGIGSCWSVPYGLCRWDFARLQVVQELQYSCTMVLMLGQK